MYRSLIHFWRMNLAVVAGVLSLIPIFGSILSTVPIVIAALVSVVILLSLLVGDAVLAASTLTVPLEYQRFRMNADGYADTALNGGHCPPLLFAADGEVFEGDENWQALPGEPSSLYRKYPPSTSVGRAICVFVSNAAFAESGW